jgi:hypothetical protein
MREACEDIFRSRQRLADQEALKRLPFPSLPFTWPKGEDGGALRAAAAAAATVDDGCKAPCGGPHLEETPVRAKGWRGEMRVSEGRGCLALAGGERWEVWFLTGSGAGGPLAFSACSRPGLPSHLVGGVRVLFCPQRRPLIQTMSAGAPLVRSGVGLTDIVSVETSKLVMVRTGEPCLQRAQDRYLPTCTQTQHDELP